MKIASRTIDFLAAALTWIAVACIGVFAAILLVPRIFGTQPYIVLSGSMEPMIHTGSLVYIEALDHDPEEGDVIAYVAADNLAVVHRVESVTDSGYIMKGDANDIADVKIVRIENVLGQYAFSIPELGYVLSFIESHQFRVGPLSFPAIVPIIIGVVFLFRLLAYLFGLVAERDLDSGE